jgi:type IV secretion system protein TrbE
MLKLTQFRDKAKGVADLFNYAVLRGPGTVLCKDGSLLSGWFFAGPDAASLSPAQHNQLTRRVNDIFARLGSGWALWIDAARIPAPGYPEREQSHFPDPVTTLIDEERRRQFRREGGHFETECAMLISYLPPLRRKQRLMDFIYDDDSGDGAIPPGERQIELFYSVMDDIEDALGEPLAMRRFSDYETTDETGRRHLRDTELNYLQFLITGDAAVLNVPPWPMYLAQILGGQELWTGDTPKIGDKYVAVVAIEGFPAESWPLILRQLTMVPMALRFSSRFIFLDQHEALSRLESQRRKWKQKARGFASQLFKTQGGYVNEDALLMTEQSESAITDANSALVAYGYYTPTVVLMDESRQTVLENARLIARELTRFGFASRIETVNALEAWLGSLPGHPYPNVRRPLFHTLNFADCLPLSVEWPGEATAPSPMYAPGAPALLHAATSGATPFRFNLHVSDVGHTLIFGPTGAGKSTLLALIAAQFRRYQNARLFVFDKGRSMYALTEAAGGAHYDLAGEGAPGLCPLAFLETQTDAAWAGEWLATCYELQTEQRLTPQQRDAVHRAVGLMRQSTEGRTLTDFIATVQDDEIRSALGAYAIDGPLAGLLDSRADGLALSSFVTFELDELMGLGTKAALPVLLYLFRRIERALDGSPALLLLDEAWVMLGHPVFREKIREWLKVLRKANAAVVLATQSLSDATGSGLFDVLVESCPTKVLLANEEAEKGGSGQVLGPRDVYTIFGLADAEIATIANGVKKKHYYYASPLGRRQFELGLGPVALSFVGASSKDDVARIKTLKRGLAVALARRAGGFL